jgi:hypothetical protein
VMGRRVDELLQVMAVDHVTVMDLKSQESLAEWGKQYEDNAPESSRG